MGRERETLSYRQHHWGTDEPQEHNTEQKDDTLDKQSQTESFYVNKNTNLNNTLHRNENTCNKTKKSKQR